MVCNKEDGEQYRKWCVTRKMVSSIGNGVQQGRWCQIKEFKNKTAGKTYSNLSLKTKIRDLK